MKSTRYVAILTILNALLLCFSDSLTQAGQAKGSGSHRGGQAGSHMSGKGLENNNAQWFADPERGWIRAEERRELHKKNHSENKTLKQSREKRRGAKETY